MGQVSAIQPGPVMCGTESVAYGTQPGTFSPSTQAVHVSDSPNAITADEQFHEFQSHQTNFEQNPDISTFTTKRVQLNFPIYGGSAANSPPRWNAFLQCAGLKGSVVAGTPGSYRWVLATRAQQATLAATISQELFGETTGWVEEVNGVYGRCVLAADAATGLTGTLTGQGLYQGPQSGTLKSIYGGGSTDWAAGTLNANKAIVSSTNRLTINNGGSDYIPIAGGWRFDTGTEYGPITDINAGATYGVFGIRISRMAPTLVVTMLYDGDTSANVDYSDLFADSQAGTHHEVTYTYTDLGGRTLAFTWDCQVRPKRPGTRENHRSLEVEYKVLDFEIQQD